MSFELLIGQTESAANFVHPGVVGCQAVEFAARSQIHAAVANADNIGSAGPHNYRDDGCPHASEARVLLGLPADISIGKLNSLGHRVDRRRFSGSLHLCDHCLDNDLRRSLAGLSAAHSVGNDMEPELVYRGETVLVLGADLPDVREPVRVDHFEPSEVNTVDFVRRSASIVTSETSVTTPGVPSTVTNVPGMAASRRTIANPTTFWSLGENTADVIAPTARLPNWTSRFAGRLAASS